MIDTAAYYHAAYVLVALTYTGYTVSLVMRARSARRRLDALRGSSSPR